MARGAAIDYLEGSKFQSVLAQCDIRGYLYKPEHSADQLRCTEKDEAAEAERQPQGAAESNGCVQGTAGGVSALNVRWW